MFKMHAIPALVDNYIWSWQLPDMSWVIVDPGEAEPVVSAIGQQAISHILLTHHHHDHTGGVAKLKSLYPNVKIYGPKNCCDHLDHVLTEGDIILGMEVAHTPGHTLDHIVYISKEQVLFGDHVFKYGCGRIFETDMATMYDSLIKIKALTKGCFGYPAHEYTVTNLNFVANYWPWPGHAQALAEAMQQKITLPFEVDEQCLHNPFLACSNLAEFTELRLARNNFPS